GPAPPATCAGRRGRLSGVQPEGVCRGSVVRQGQATDRGGGGAHHAVPLLHSQPYQGGAPRRRHAAGTDGSRLGGGGDEGRLGLRARDPDARYARRGTGGGAVAAPTWPVPAPFRGPPAGGCWPRAPIRGREAK